MSDCLTSLSLTWPHVSFHAIDEGGYIKLGATYLGLIRFLDLNAKEHQRDQAGNRDLQSDSRRSAIPNNDFASTFALLKELHVHVLPSLGR